VNRNSAKENNGINSPSQDKIVFQPDILVTEIYRWMVINVYLWGFLPPLKKKINVRVVLLRHRESLKNKKEGRNKEKKEGRKERKIWQRCERFRVENSVLLGYYATSSGNNPDERSSHL